MNLPRMFRLRQRLKGPRLANIPQAVEQELGRLDLSRRIAPRETVAVTAGSRGIANMALILRAVVAHLQLLGAKPFLVPAMGSHGGATAEGQREVLDHYGITSDSVGCPIHASMETVVIGHTAGGLPIHFDRHAHEADHVFVVNRVKAHTRFAGELESGLHKMLLIGLGKCAGAELYHRAIADFGFDAILEAASTTILEQCGIAGGLAILENGRDETALLAGLAPQEFGVRERELLRQARDWMAGLPFARCDLLIVDEIGKDISGSGMDANVVGRKYDDKKSTSRDPTQVRRIFVRGLTEGTHGNATGIGLADVTLDRAVAQIDRRVTAVNCITGDHLAAGAIPIAFATDREAIEAALSTIGLTKPSEARILRIANTLEVGECWASEAYWSEAESREDLAADSPLEPMHLNAGGILASAFS